MVGWCGPKMLRPALAEWIIGLVGGGAGIGALRGTGARDRRIVSAQRGLVTPLVLTGASVGREEAAVRSVRAVAFLFPRDRGLGSPPGIYYGVMMIAPRVAGGLAERADDPGLAFHLGAGMCVVALMCLAAFRRMAAR